MEKKVFFGLFNKKNQTRPHNFFLFRVGVKGLEGGGADEGEWGNGEEREKEQLIYRYAKEALESVRKLDRYSHHVETVFVIVFLCECVCVCGYGCVGVCAFA